VLISRASKKQDETLEMWQLSMLTQPSQLRRVFGRSKGIRVDKAFAANKHFQMCLWWRPSL
jgi:hypothetical protein